jgi:type II secretory pathway predicted ATPase ExeA
MAYLEYGLHQNEGFIVVTGEWARARRRSCEASRQARSAQVVAGQLVSTQLDAEDMLRLAASSFGLRTKGVEKSDLLLSLEAFLVSTSQQGKRALLIVDEAQNLTPRAIEELRMLSNFQLETHALLQSFLVGQPEFRRTMQSAEMSQLRQRVIAACHIGPMDPRNARLRRASTDLRRMEGRPQFESGAFEGVFHASPAFPGASTRYATG